MTAYNKHLILNQEKIKLQYLNLKYLRIYAKMSTYYG